MGSTMRKLFVLDTNVLLFDPMSMTKLRGNDIVLPMPVLEELDKLKKGDREKSKAARDVIRFIDSARQFGKLNSWVKVEEFDIRLMVESLENDSPSFASLCNNAADKEYKDNIILAICMDMLAKAKKSKKRRPILITKDIALRCKADAVGVDCEDYKEGAIKNREILEDDIEVIEAPAELIDEVFSETKEHGGCSWPDHEQLINTPYVLKGHGKSALVLFGEDSVRAVLPQEVYGLTPKNKEQQFSIDLLMDPAIPLVALLGPAGTGKSIIALAAALEMVNNKNQYEKFCVCRVPVDMGKGIGFLPGPQPLDAKVLTPTGFVEMGSLKVGDLVVGSNGLPVEISQIRPQGEQVVYKISTSDGRSTEATADHLWSTMDHREYRGEKGYSVKSTSEILSSLVKANNWGKRKTIYNHRLPNVKPVEFSQRDLPIDPYILGVLLGDGSFGKNVSPSFVDFDGGIMEEVQNRLPSDLRLNAGKERTHFTIVQSGEVKRKVGKPIFTSANGVETQHANIAACADAIGIPFGSVNYLASNNREVKGHTLSFKERDRTFNNPMKEEIHQLGLVGKNHVDKFIPEIYLRSSVENRLWLLRGLMDTDGTCKQNGEASFSTTSTHLANGIKDIVLSLGGKATIKSRMRKPSKSDIDGRQIVSRHPELQVSISTPLEINPFNLQRKSERYKNAKTRQAVYITDIQEVGVKEVQCLVIDSTDHLYVTDDYIVTHNSEAEKLKPWLEMVNDNYHALVNMGKKGKAKATFKATEDQLVQLMHYGKYEMLSTSLIRGRSLPNAIIIVEEAQNLSPHEIKSIITRAGQGTKVVLLGDPDQIDVPYLDKYSNGLSYVVDRYCKDEEGRKHFGFVRLTKSERSKLAEISGRIL